MLKRIGWLAATLLVALVPTTAAAEGADGELDVSFGDGGLAMFPGYRAVGGHPMAVQSDGGIVLVGSTEPSLGDVLVGRFLADGSPDPAFGVGGVVTTDLGGAEQAVSVASQADGRILVAGTTWTESDPDVRSVLVRYTVDGSPDTTFAGDGIVEPAIDSGVRDLVVQPDGRIVLLAVDDDGVTLARHLPDGRPDPAFGAAGVVTTSFGDDLGWAEGVGLFVNAMALQGDGSVVVAGSRLDSNVEQADVGVLRYRPDGSLDAAFGELGVATVDLSQSDLGASVAVQPDGKIVVSGRSYAGGGGLLLARLDPDGSLDAGFGDGGVVLPSYDDPEFVGRPDGGTSVAVHADGQIVVASSWSPCGGSPNTLRSPDAAVLRFDVDGTPDRTFGDGGAATVAFGEETCDEGLAVAWQPNGGLLVAGDAHSGTTDPSDFLVVARLRSSAAPVPSTTAPATQPPSTGPVSPTLPSTGGSMTDVIVPLAGAVTAIGLVATILARRRPRTVR